MEPASAHPPDPPAAERSAGAARMRWERLFPRRRFRARLQRDPRRWVLFIVAMDGLIAPVLNLPEKRELLFSRGFGPAFLLLVLSTMPATSVLILLVHGRLLFWSGRILGGEARPHELHAAFAWSQAPFVAVGWPLLLDVPLRVAAADLETVPAWLEWSIDAAVRIGKPVEVVATIAAVVGAFLWVKYVAEAQRFSSWRAIANLLMGGVLLLALFAGGGFLGVALMPKSIGMVHAGIASAVVLAVVGAGVLIGRARNRRPRPA